MQRGSIKRNFLILLCFSQQLLAFSYHFLTALSPNFLCWRPSSFEPADFQLRVWGPVLQPGSILYLTTEPRSTSNLCAYVCVFLPLGVICNTACKIALQSMTLLEDFKSSNYLCLTFHTASFRKLSKLQCLAKVFMSFQLFPHFARLQTQTLMYLFQIFLMHRKKICSPGGHSSINMQIKIWKECSGLAFVMVNALNLDVNRVHMDVIYFKKGAKMIYLSSSSFQFKVMFSKYGVS